MKKLLIVLFGALFLFACAPTEEECFRGDDLSDISLKKKGEDHYVPFKSEFIEVGGEEIADEDAWMHFWVYGNGKATHLGKSTMKVDQKWYEEWGTMGGLVGYLGDGIITFTAANGDELNAYYECIFNPFNYPNLVLWGEGIFTGGTGRFENATGSFVYEGTFNNDPTINSGESTYIGEIMYKRN